MRIGRIFRQFVEHYPDNHLRDFPDSKKACVKPKEGLRREQGYAEMEQKLLTERTMSVEFEKKLKRLDEILQTFSDEEMLRLASLLERQLEFHKRSPLVEM